MSRDPRGLPRPLAERATEQYCGPCKGKTRHIKMAVYPSTYETSYCLECRPELLDATDTGKHPYESLDRWELRRLIRTRDRFLGTELRVYLKHDGATSVEAVVSHFANRGAA